LPWTVTALIIIKTWASRESVDTNPPTSTPTHTPLHDKNGKYEISSEGIRANFIAYGASISNLFIEDIHGEVRDIVLGFDNASYYEIDKQHPHLGGVPGRYANRIKNSTFEIDGQEYHIDANEHGGLNTLHGGGKYSPELTIHHH
jgi:aldose 1-epimerase